MTTAAILSGAVRGHAAQPAMFETLAPAIANATSQFGEIPEERRALLDEGAGWIRQRLASGETAPLLFICTHNSRRSHLGQAWAAVAARYYGLEGVETFSGGTEVTACNIRTIRSLRRSGFSVVESTAGDNPVYLIQFAEGVPPLEAFSKVFEHAGNPQKGFAAFMTCSSADAACPIVSGADARIAIPYEDPKASDGSSAEAATYDARSAQIAREMFYMLSRVR